ncbi:MAG: lysophospholipid acyltransferase family protein [Pseudomonadales bacterium]
MNNILNTLLRALMRLQALLPLPISQALGSSVGLVGYLCNSRGTLVTRQNLRLCFPDKTDPEIAALTRSSMQHTGMTAFETPAVWLAPKRRTVVWIRTVENEALLDAAMATGKGTIILLPHLGNWELFNVYFATKGRMTALYHPPRQDWLKPLMSEIRGDNLVPTNRRGLMTLYKELEAGHVVTVLPDQVPASGQFAPFFNEPALTDRLVPRMIQKTGAQAVVCIVYRQGNGFNIRFEAPADELYSDNMDTALSGLNRSVEQVIRSHVPQYQWEYKRFRERPEGYKKLYKFAGQPQYYHRQK